MSQTGRAVGDVGLVLAMVALLVLATFLPPDTSMAELRRVGVLRACVPVQYPPLVTGESDAPGIDVELLRAIADELELRLALNRVTGMGRDFNPRNWRVTRAQCQVLAGGVVASPATRTYLETTTPYLSTGWALLTPESLPSLQGETVGFYSGTSGLDRIALGRYLREQGARPVTVSTAAELESSIRDGTFSAGVSEALLVRRLASDNAWHAVWLPERLGRYPLALGLWKGDLTLKRAIEQALARIEAAGRLEEIEANYELVAIEGK